MNILKKWFLIIALVMLSIGLVACGEKAEEVYTKSLEAADKMESAEITTVLNQEITMGSEGKLKIKSDMDGSVIVDPVAMHQKGTMAMTMEGEGMEGEAPFEMDTEIYLVDDEMYMFESLSQQWLKADSSLIPIDTLTTNQPDVSEQLKMLEEYVEEFEFEEVDNEYVFKLKADGGGVKRLSEKMLEEYLPQDITSQLGDIQQVLKDMEIKKLSIEMIIDNKTYHVKKFNLDMEMSMTVEGQTLDVVQQVKSEYKGVNTIDSIEIPQEVKDNALDAG